MSEIIHLRWCEAGPARAYEKKSPMSAIADIGLSQARSARAEGC